MIEHANNNLIYDCPKEGDLMKSKIKSIASLIFIGCSCFGNCHFIYRFKQKSLPTHIWLLWDLPISRESQAQATISLDT